MTSSLRDTIGWDVEVQTCTYAHVVHTSYTSHRVELGWHVAIYKTVDRDDDGSDVDDGSADVEWDDHDHEWDDDERDGDEWDDHDHAWDDDE